MAEKQGVVDSIRIGSGYPTYVWRKGSSTNYDNTKNLYLTVNREHNGDVNSTDLVEINPLTKKITFFGEINVDNVIGGIDSVAEIDGSKISNGSIDSSQLKPGIAIDGSIDRLTNKHSINGMLFDGTVDVNCYGVCQTDANQQLKTVTIDNYQVSDGAIVYVKFAKGNTVNFPTLSINGSKARNISYQGNFVSSDKIAGGGIYQLIATGSNTFEIVGGVNEDLDTVITDNIKVNATDSTIDQYQVLVTDQTSPYVGSINFTDGLTINPNSKSITTNSYNSNVTTNSWSNVYSHNSTIINATNQTNLLKGLIVSDTNQGLFALTNDKDSICVSYASTSDIIDNPNNRPDKLVKLLDTDGNASFPNTVTASNFNGLASKATADGNGNVINTTYASKGELQNSVTDINSSLSSITTNVNNLQSSVSSISQQVTNNTNTINTLNNSFTSISSQFDTINQTVVSLTGNAVTTSPQTLSDIQKSQVLTNLGIVSTNTNGVITSKLPIINTSDEDSTDTTTINGYISVSYDPATKQYNTHAPSPSLANPQNDNIATVEYVNTSLTGYATTESVNNVNSRLSGYLPLTGGQLTGVLNSTADIKTSAWMYANTFRATSDLNLKENIKEIHPDLSSLKAYSYSFKKDHKKGYGLIAQQVQQILPDAVSTIGEDNHLTLDYNAVVAALVDEVNRLKKRVNALESK